jgi:hypothetical protein
MTDRLAALLRGERGAMAGLAAADAVLVADAADRHGVLPLLADRLARDATSDAETLRRLVHARATNHAASDLVREQDLRGLLAAFQASGVEALLVKGAHLAYAVYPRPDLRPRVDTDVLIRPDSRAAAVGVLDQLGYAAATQAGGDLINYQATFVRQRGARVTHVVDLHWRLANPQVFGDVLSFDDLDREAVPVPAVGGRAPGRVHALLVACIHRVAHHPDDERLIWLYDVDLLARLLDITDWEHFMAWADARRVGAVCGRGLEQACARFGTPVPAVVRTDARLSSTRARTAATAAFLEPGRRHVRTVAQDFSLLPTWTARSKFVFQHLFPPPAYMRRVYAPASHWPLPVLYAHRACRGAWRWFVKS